MKRVQKSRAKPPKTKTGSRRSARVINQDVLDREMDAINVTHGSWTVDDQMGLQHASPGTQQRGKLLDLPAELREEICRLAVIYDYDYIGVRCAPKWVTDISPSAVTLMSSLPGLLGACKQLRNEASSIFWGENKFYPRSGMNASVWLGAIGAERRKLLRHVLCDMTGRITGKVDHATLVEMDRVEGLLEKKGMALGENVLHLSVKGAVNRLMIEARLSEEEWRLYENFEMR